MSLKSIFSFAQISLVVAFVAVSAAPALAQDAFGSGTQTDDTSMAATGIQVHVNTAFGSQAQYFDDERAPILQGATSGTISPQLDDEGAPILQGATSGTLSLQLDDEGAPILQSGTASGVISSQGDQATVILDVNTAGTVRVHNLDNLEALLNIIANGIEILGAWCIPIMILGFCIGLLAYKTL